MVLKNLFAGQHWKNIHKEQTYGHGERGEEGEMCGKSNMKTFITVCKIEQIAVGYGPMAQETQKGALYQLRGVGWGGEIGGRFKRKGIYLYLWLIHVEV